MMCEVGGITLRIDDIDRKILAALGEDGRESYSALGSSIGLSTAATKRRVDRLRQDGDIQGITAVAELASLTPPVFQPWPVTAESDGSLLVRARYSSHFEKVLGLIRTHPGVSR